MKMSEKKIDTKKLMIFGLIVALCMLAVPAMAAVVDVTCPAFTNSALATCTAGDVHTDVKHVEILNDQCSTTGMIELEITANYTSTANQRYDLGIFLAKDLGNVEGKKTDPNMALNCVGVAPQALIDGTPVFENLDSTGHSDTPDTLDTCGDLSAALGPVDFTFTATVACQFDANGDISIPACRVWEQNPNHKISCENPADAGTGYKCDCSPFTVEYDPCASLDCDDNNVCTTDSCIVENNQAGCVNNPGALDCDDDDVCTTDTCDATDGCVNTPGALDCDDDDVCTDRHL